MSIGLCFWIIILIGILFGVAVVGGFVHPVYFGFNSLVELALFVLLGWATFGPPLRRG